MLPLRTTGVSAAASGANAARARPDLRAARRVSFAIGETDLSFITENDTLRDGGVSGVEAQFGNFRLKRKYNIIAHKCNNI
jgi:hypothetical protein